jgi:hypothetical protein
MTKIIRSNLHRHVVVDKSEAALDSYSALAIPRTMANEVILVLRRTKGKGGGEGFLYIQGKLPGSKIFFKMEINDSEVVQLHASYCPQKWDSGQNVLPLVRTDGGLPRSLADIVKLPFVELSNLLEAKKSNKSAQWVRDNLKNIRWQKLDFATYTRIVDDCQTIMDFITGICGRVERAKTKALGVANCLNFKFKDYVSKTTGLPCGVTFNKQAGTYNIFSLSLYRKDLEVMDRDAEGRAGEIEKDSMGLVKNRMRVESHIFPPMFYRGRAKKFKQIFLGVDLERMSKKEEDMQKYFGSVRFLEDSKATVETLKKCIAEISYQLGLHLIFAAESPKEVYRKMTEGASEEELEIARIWKAGKEITPEVVGMPKNKFYDLVNSIEERVGFLPTKVPVSTFNWIRSSLMYSMLTEKEHDLMCALDNTMLGSSEYGKSGKIMLELKKKAADRATASLESMRVAAKSFGMLKS